MKYDRILCAVLSGIGLMEIVTEPDFRTPDEAAAFVRELQQIMCRLDTCDGIMAGQLLN